MNRRDGALMGRMELPRQATRKSNLQPVPDPDEPFFPVALRGYDRQAVDDYVEDVSRVIAELEATPPEQTAIKDALDRIGEDTSGILQHAHDTADSITTRAHQQAQREIQEAEREAERMRADAEARVQQLAGDTHDVWRERAALLEDMRRLAEGLLEVADSAADRLPDLPKTFAAGNGASRGSAPPPPPPPGAETTHPPPPHPLDVGHTDAGEIVDDAELVDGAVIEEPEAQEFAHEDFDGPPPPAPRRPQPPRSTTHTAQPTQPMDALSHEDVQAPGEGEAFNGQSFTAFWERRHQPER